MKTIYKGWFFTTIFLLFLTSCDTIYCGRSVFVNSSDHDILVLTYRYGQIDKEVSMINSLLPGGRDTLGARYCNQGWTASPFAGTWLHDSIVIIFNDTLSVLMFAGTMPPELFREQNPLMGRLVWKEVPRPYADDGGTIYFEYEFTNWHFEQAVEFSRR